MSQNQSLIQDLVKWAEDNNTSLAQNVEIYQDPITGLSFRAAEDEDVAPGTIVVKCSYQTTLSYLSAIQASPCFKRHGSEPFPPDFIESLSPEDPNIISHFFLVQQYLMGEKSFWWPYIRLLPQPDQPESMGIPIWWPEADQKFLNGTNAEPPIKARKGLWEAEWAKGIAALKGKLSGSDKYTYILYQWAATIFGSRSFRASLTIPPEILQDPSTLDHIRKDRFSILLPVMDIGNHNGVNQVNWSPDPSAGTFNLSNRYLVTKGTQIYNYYGDKSNSELLVAYGFTLPQIDKNRVNLRVTPLSQTILLRRSQKYHVILENQREQEFMFNVQMNLRDCNGRKKGIQESRCFSDGLFDTMICMVANKREQKFILENPTYCPERDGTLLEGPLARSAFQALGILQLKLEHEVSRMQTTETGAISGKAENSNQRLALEYRKQHIDVLKASIPPLLRRVSSISSSNSMCSHNFHNGAQDKEAQPTQITTEFISLECAFDWLRNQYPKISVAVENIISEDQEEPRPLNWALLVGDWDHTYWIVWLYIVWLLESQGAGFQSRHPNLTAWIAEMNLMMVKDPPDNILNAEASEQETINHMVHAIDQFPQLQLVVKRLELKNGGISAMRNLASFIAKEETVRAPHLMQNGQTVEQGLLCIFIRSPSSYSDE